MLSHNLSLDAKSLVFFCPKPLTDTCTMVQIKVTNRKIAALHIITTLMPTRNYTLTMVRRLTIYSWWRPPHHCERERAGSTVGVEGEVGVRATMRLRWQCRARYLRQYSLIWPLQWPSHLYSLVKWFPRTPSVASGRRRATTLC